MAMSSEQSRTLDRMRTQLALTTQSVAGLRYQLEINDPLPTWNTIQSSASALAFNMDLVMKLLEENAQFLKEAHAYPTTSFPGNTHENILGQLLRKKLEPGAEDWIHEHTTQRQAEQQANGVGKHDQLLKDDDLRELWTWALGSSRRIAEPMAEDGAWLDNYTLAERVAGIENVITGLKRDLERDSEDDDDDEDDDIDEDGMEDVEVGEKADVKEGEEGIDPSLTPMPLENVLKFVTTGALPTAGRPNR